MRFRLIMIVLFAAFSIENASAQSEDGLVRAGCPNQISRLARCGYGKRYVVYYVGGGAPTLFGHGRYSDEGTFGVDYQPIVPGFHTAVSLNWWHGRRFQGGTGQFQPNGTVTPFPNRRRITIGDDWLID